MKASKFPVLMLKSQRHLTAGDLGDYEVTEASDGGTEVILGSPFKFDPSNIDEWKDVY